MNEKLIEGKIWGVPIEAKLALKLKFRRDFRLQLSTKDL